MKRMCEAVASRANDERGRDMSMKVTDRKKSTRVIDRMAEEVVVQYVERNALPLNILSEEAGLIDRGFEETLIVDPIDGTHNAIRGIPFYSTALAVGKGDTSGVRCGLVMNLATADTFWASKGEGAYLNGSRIRTRRFAETGSMFLGYIGRHTSKDVDRIYRLPTRFRALGCASLELCLVASGKADAYLTLTASSDYGLHVWDIAAACLILDEAGGGSVIPTDKGYQPMKMGFDAEERISIISYGDRGFLEFIKA
jgi:fructose-1,6-bisphosphatase/inositol monophosphatase family enzyme